MSLSTYFEIMSTIDSEIAALGKEIAARQAKIKAENEKQEEKNQEYQKRIYGIKEENHYLASILNKYNRGSSEAIYEVKLEEYINPSILDQNIFEYKEQNAKLVYDIKELKKKNQTLSKMIQENQKRNEMFIQLHNVINYNINVERFGIKDEEEPKVSLINFFVKYF